MMNNLSVEKWRTIVTNNPLMKQVSKHVDAIEKFLLGIGFSKKNDTTFKFEKIMGVP